MYVEPVDGLFEVADQTTEVLQRSTPTQNDNVRSFRSLFSRVSSFARASQLTVVLTIGTPHI